ncbi:MAG: glycosyltransferase [Planctomycetota bacterium]|nr:glycosyltransferase [Planctomycetota bacterium]
MSGHCDVIIPSKNAPSWLALCLEELFRNTDPQELGQVLVVDDGSSPEALPVIERICARHKGVRLLANEGRRGLGGACNFGVQHATAPSMLFLNTECLVTRGTIRKLVAACETDAFIGMACPLSNSSPGLALPMPPGRSYVEMNALLEQAGAGLPPAELALEACTPVGHCLLVTRRCWEKTGDFGEVWDGAESDSQMRAMEHGFRGVALTNAYVFRFGNATSWHEPGASALRDKNRNVFFAKWGDKYKALLAKQARHDPVATAAQRLAALPSAPLTPPVLFLLPGLGQEVGGIQVVVELCNHLIRQGLEARCAVLGSLDRDALKRFQEPVFFGLLHFPGGFGFPTQTEVAPQCVVATLFTTVPPGFVFACQRGIPLVYFVQGYECYFVNGTFYNQVAETYAMADHLLVTSEWLKKKVESHARSTPLTVLPIGVDPYLFAAKDAEQPASGKVRIGVVLRNAPDKGQWILLDVLNALSAHKDVLDLTVFSARQYELPPGWAAGNCTQLALPLARSTIAAHLRACDVFLDASLHEGFGLFPLEAMACGATVVVSDSGGVGQYVRSGENGLVISEVNRPEQYVAAILSLVRDRPLLARLKADARKTAASFAAPESYGRYADFFRQVVASKAARPKKEQAAALRAALTMLKTAEREIDARDKRIATLEEERERITSGASFRVGRLLTAPFRALLGKR